jgi:hypothetical protein
LSVKRLLALALVLAFVVPRVPPRSKLLAGLGLEEGAEE